jgi:hypothetical protein
MLYYNITEVHAWARLQIAVLAALIARVLQRFHPQGRGQCDPKKGAGDPKEGRREDRVRAAPAVSRAKAEKKTHTSIQVQRRQSGLPCAVVLRLISCSPWRPAFLSPSPRGNEPARLDASIGAPGPHDFAVRDRPRSSVVSIASIASHRAFVTIASRPSYRVGWRIEDVIWVRTTAEYFREAYWTKRWCNRPDRQRRCWWVGGASEAGPPVS